MDTKIEKKDEYIEITINEVGDKKDQVLAAFGLCQSGQCQCPTNEYKNLEKMDIIEGDDVLTLRLYPKPGKEMDLNEIQTCLDFTTQ